MTTTREVLLNSITSIEKLRIQTGSPIHALIWGKWGPGKSYEAQKIERPNVFYAKIPDGQLSKSRLVKILALALGSGYRNLYEGTLDLMRYHILEKGLKHPIFILDEGQRILKSSLLMSELKDLSEDRSLNFSYVFLGDQTIPKIYQSNPHSIHKRVLIKKQLEALNLINIKELASHYQINTDEEFINIILQIGTEKGWTTIDIAFLFSYIKALAKKGKSPSTKEQIQKLAEKIGI